MSTNIYSLLTQLNEATNLNYHELYPSPPKEKAKIINKRMNSLIIKKKEISILKLQNS